MDEVTRFPYKFLTAELVIALRQVADQIETGRISPLDLEKALSLVGELPIDSFDRLRVEIAQAANLKFQQPSIKQAVATIFRHDSYDLLRDFPQLAWLFLFHFDGRLREAALNALSMPRAGAFWFAAIAYRLNDWALPVRKAAIACAGRLFPNVASKDVTQVALPLLEEMPFWQRSGEFDALDNIFVRNDVTADLVSRITSEPTGKMARLMSLAVRNEHLLAYLPSLAKESVQPSVKALALKWLIEGIIKWPDPSQPFHKKWIDKSQGRFRWERPIKSINVLHEISVKSLILHGLNDPSVLVRKTAMWGLLESKNLWASQWDLIDTLMKDKSPTIREWSTYIFNQINKQSS